MPFGVALGYGISGFVANISWSIPFWLESALMTALAFLCLFIKNPSKVKKIHGPVKAAESDTDESDQEKLMESAANDGASDSRPSDMDIVKTKTPKPKANMLTAVRELSCNSVYVLTVLGYV